MWRQKCRLFCCRRAVCGGSGCGRYPLSCDISDKSSRPARPDRPAAPRSAGRALSGGAAVLADQRGGKQKTEIFGCLCELLEQRNERCEEQKRRIAQRSVQRIPRKERLRLLGVSREVAAVPLQQVAGQRLVVGVCRAQEQLVSGQAAVAGLTLGGLVQLAGHTVEFLLKAAEGGRAIALHQERYRISCIKKI